MSKHTPGPWSWGRFHFQYQGCKFSVSAFADSVEPIKALCKELARQCLHYKQRCAHSNGSDGTLVFVRREP